MTRNRDTLNGRAFAFSLICLLLNPMACFCGLGAGANIQPYLNGFVINYSSWYFALGHKTVVLGAAVTLS
jgi:hypothetical protein